MKKKALLLSGLLLLFLGATFFRGTQSSIHFNLDKLSPEHIARTQALLARLEPFIEANDAAGKIPTLTFQELAAPLSRDERHFLRAFRNLKGKDVGVRIPYQGLSQGVKNLVAVKGQKMKVNGVVKELPPQFLTRPVYQVYEAMMRAMERDLDKRLLLESGYRSSAHQLYLFIFYLSNHAYSIRETAKWVALPGYSEHGDPVHLALDFINVDGINGEKNVVDFEALPEFEWLLKNAGRFGFELSYPKHAPEGITYEPWHWHFNGAPAQVKN